MNKIIEAIENMQVDHEESQKTLAIEIFKQDACYFVKNSEKDSLFSNKVVYAHPGLLSPNEIIEKAEDFFTSPFSWYCNRDLDCQMIQVLEEKGWVIKDIYDGRYIELGFEHLNVEQKVRVLEYQDDYLMDFSKLVASVWQIENSDYQKACQAYNKYLKAKDRRGSVILSFENDKVVGYSNFRMSKCGDYMYLCGTGVLEAYRNKGHYRAMLNYRLNLGIQLGAQYAISQARQGYSSPILEKLGFSKIAEYAYLLKE